MPEYTIFVNILVIVIKSFILRNKGLLCVLQRKRLEIRGGKNFTATQFPFHNLLILPKDKFLEGKNMVDIIYFKNNTAALNEQKFFRSSICD